MGRQHDWNLARQGISNPSDFDGFFFPRPSQDSPSQRHLYPLLIY